MPTVIETADRFRSQLRNKETSATNDLLTAYRGVTNRLEDKLTVLQSKIEVLEKNGNLTPENVRKLAVWGSLLNQIEDEITKYGGYVATQNKVAAQATIDMASKHSKLLTQTYFNDNPNLVKAFNASWDVLPSESIETLVGFLRPDSELTRGLERTIGQTATQNFQDKLIEGVSLGYGSRKINSLINQTLSEPLTWSINTVRTTQNYAYRETTRANYINNSEILGGWKWYAALDGRVCLSCVNQHGRDFPLNARLNDHHQGRCTQIPLIDKPERFGLKSPEVELGEQWFNKLPKPEQINRMGIDRHAAYRSGKFKFTDLSETYQNDSFGEMLKEASLKSILGKVKPAKPKRQFKPKATLDDIFTKPKAQAKPTLTANRQTAKDVFRLDSSLDDKLSKAGKEALDLIDNVHTFPKGINKTPVIELKGEKEAIQGRYNLYADGSPKAIEVSKTAQRPVYTTIHEIGHYIDYHVISNIDSSLAATGAKFSEWRDAVKSTEAYKTLRDMNANPDLYSVDIGNNRTVKPDKNYTSYLIQDNELWARSYMQYIMKKNGLESSMSYYTSDILYGSIQWQDKDFNTVEAAFDKLFEDLKWK